ncbi:YsnF/AvaK domain-containing protein [Bacillus sp. FJAT-44742]|uniref:YsnF/AvaK domain-containing protein n=1 Tax=Bacillus sp. FJAT-44742 TaxID=2014005 RepID=UPI000C248E39|nr:YsnF/AvaK domain-containing protein [Bacillus sp. FJAT-44742]
MSFFKEDSPKENRASRKQEQATDTEFARDNAHIELREEEIDVHKHRAETGDVTLHKDIIEEEKEINVPLSHDQVVIERKAVNHEPSEEPIGKEETIRIPVTAEKLDVDKHTVVTGEVSAHKQAVEETEQIKDVLHKEVADVEEHGDAEIINDDK